MRLFPFTPLASSSEALSRIATNSLVSKRGTIGMYELVLGDFGRLFFRLESF